MESAYVLVAEHRRQQEPLPILTLAAELGVHKSTLEAAIRKGRLPARFSTRSVFGRPVRLVVRGDGERFKQSAYKRRNTKAVCEPLLQVPADYPEQLVRIRRKLKLTQAALAQEIGAANKAVIYQ